MSSWDEHQKLVMAELKRASEERTEIAKEMVVVRVEVAKLKAMASTWGAVAGVIAGAIVSLVTALFSRN